MTFDENQESGGRRSGLHSDSIIEDEIIYSDEPSEQDFLLNKSPGADGKKLKGCVNMWFDR